MGVHRQRRIETLDGRGRVLRGEDWLADVLYRLEVYQEYISFDGSEELQDSRVLRVRCASCRARKR